MDMDIDFYSTNSPYVFTAKIYNEDEKEWDDSLKWISFREILSNWIDKVIKKELKVHYSLLKAFENLTREERNEQLDKFFKYIKQCAFELMEMVLESINGRIGTESLQPVFCACFIIALKLIGAHDWYTNSNYIYLTFSIFADGTISSLLPPKKLKEILRRN